MSEFRFHQRQFQLVFLMFARLILLREKPKGLTMTVEATIKVVKVVKVVVKAVVVVGN
jgi:hypothetical protein